MEEQGVKYSSKDFKKYDFLDYLNVLEKGELDRVYRPNDDSYFMLDILNLQAEKDIQRDAIIMEIGSGSGILINHLVHFLTKLEKPPSLAIATDINYDANILTQKYANLHSLPQVECINTNIANSLVARLQGKVDVIICNPPYVPTEQEELKKAMQLLREKDRFLKAGNLEKMKEINCIDASYAGGENGMIVTQQMIDTSLELLSKGGSLYIFLVFENDVEGIISTIKIRQPDIHCQILAKQRRYNELQYILQCKRQY